VVSSAQGERLPTDRSHEGGVADQRHRLAREQQPEVAVPQRLERARRPRPAGHRRHAANLVIVELKAVLFDVDFTLAKPGPDLGPDGYRRAGKRHGLDLDPARYPEARAGAIESLERHPELRHDEERWIVFTERIIRGMGGDSAAAPALAVEMTRLWENSANFDLYDDVLPVLAELRRHGLRLGLVSNSGREIEDFVAHHRLDVDCALTSRAHGWTKPHESIFRAALELLRVEPAEAAMVGDSVEEDIEGALALGMRAHLIDREGRYPEAVEALPDLWALPAALGL
jgi:HAD superfamily hydrolase (TIGR01549 family)